MTNEAGAIHRGKTAIGRAEFSRPVKALLESQLLENDQTFFDYGCGRGGDLRRLKRLGFEADGWDPAHRTTADLREADVVNIGYVINVIEDPEEREHALRRAWSLSRNLLVVAARLTDELRGCAADSFGDGCLTKQQTFQKFYTQSELRAWIEAVLDSEAVAAAPGVFFVFRDTEQRQRFISARLRRRRAAPRIRKSDLVYETHKELLQPLTEFLTERGRLPLFWEMNEGAAIEEQFGSLRRAFALIRRVTGRDQWDLIRAERREELLVQLALERFGGVRRFGELPPDLQQDVKDFFVNYKRAQELAEEQMFSLGDPIVLDEALRTSPIGKLTGNALYVHVDALPELPALLRIYEGCAHGFVGRVDGANLVKLHRNKPKISYLSYPDFDRDPHPALRVSVSVSLQNFTMKVRRYDSSKNPPILHRKEDFLTADDSRRERFERLTRQEERWGLYEDTARIGLQQGWLEVLEAKNLALRGHRVVRTIRA